jgi:predicted AAA+ superfamily ATPase
VPPGTIRRFWTMLSHYHGQLWNAAELGRSFGVSEKTVRSYLDILCSTYLARRLPPYHANLAKREVKAPKVYVNDCGLLHSLLDLESRADVLGHPKAGASFEGFAIQEIVRQLGARDEQCHFWGVHTGAELDLLVVHGKRRLGFEIKLTDAPELTRSMHSALESLELDSLDVVHAGAKTFPMADRVRAVAVHRLLVDLEPLAARGRG